MPRDKKVDFTMNFELHFIKFATFTISLKLNNKTAYLMKTTNQYYFPKIQLSRLEFKAFSKAAWNALTEEIF